MFKINVQAVDFHKTESYQIVSSFKEYNSICMNQNFVKGKLNTYRSY